MKSPREPIARILYRLGVSADALTFLGLLAAFAAGALAYQGRLPEAGAMVLVSGVLDMLDGAVARLSGKASVFGGILDSTLDRYGDGFVLGGVLFYCFHEGKPGFALLAASALLGSFSISYARARAECEMDSCRVGYWERAERIVYIALGLLLNNLGVALLVLGTTTHLTVLYRLYAARYPERQAAWLGSPAPFWRAFLLDTRRQSPHYAVKTGFWVLLVLAVRLPV